MTVLKQMGDNDLKELGIPMVLSFTLLFVGIAAIITFC